MTEPNTQIIGSTAYNNFETLATIGYNCVKYLILNNDMIWKLLKYTTPNAWSENNLTNEEKAQLIYAGESDTSNYNVFLDGKQPDVETKEKTLLRIMPEYAVGLNRTVGLIRISMEVYSHYKINHLSNYQTRIDRIAQELLETFNGTLVGGFGNMVFNKMTDESSRLFEVGQIPFGGKKILFSIYDAS
jgi:hypothetical protein